VRVQEGGDVLQTITVDRGCFSCALGGSDGPTLFIVGAEWHRLEHMVKAPAGQLVTVDVASAYAGRP
jgi:sugar lactone lactonase YvrE